MKADNFPVMTLEETATDAYTHVSNKDWSKIKNTIDLIDSVKNQMKDFTEGAISPPLIKGDLGGFRGISKEGEDEKGGCRGIWEIEKK